MKKTLIIFVFVVSSWFCIAKDYSEKIYLWEDIPKMETNIRDSVLYYCTTKNLDSEKPESPCIPRLFGFSLFVLY